MNDYSEQTIRILGNRSLLVVLAVTLFFALLGAHLVISIGGSAIWGAWIPFCFLLIPAVHFVCRELLRLQQRVRELEKKLEQH